MEALPLEIFCELASFLSCYDLFRLGVVNKALRALSRQQAVWNFRLKRRKYQFRDFYQGCLRLQVEVVVAAGARFAGDFIDECGSELFDYVEKKRDPALLLQIQQLHYIPPLFLVREPSEWLHVFSCEDRYPALDAFVFSHDDKYQHFRTLLSERSYAEPGDCMIMFLMRNPRNNLLDIFRKSPNFRGKHGLTPLFLKEDVEGFLELGSDPSICDDAGRNAVFAALCEVPDFRWVS